jgi:hypothetical protein
MIVVQFRNRPGIQFIKCHFQKDGVDRAIWLAPWEVMIDFHHEIRENGKVELWRLVKVLVPDQEP